MIWEALHRVAIVLKKSASCTCDISKLLLIIHLMLLRLSRGSVYVSRCGTKWLHRFTYRDAAVIVDVNIAEDNSLLTDMKAVKLALL